MHTHKHLTYPKYTQTTHFLYYASASLINGDNSVKIMGQLNADVIGSWVEVYINRVFNVNVNSAKHRGHLS